MDETPEQPPAASPNQPLSPHHCTGCGAGLREDLGACVYCGTRCVRIPGPVAPTPPAEPEIPLTVPQDALCRGCGYALIGLQISDFCPECGRPVLESVRGDELRFCDPKYLQSLHRGIVLIQASLVSLLIITVLTILVQSVIGGGLAAQSITSFLSLVPAAISLAGWYIVSVPDPGVNLEDKGDKPRKVLRIAAIVNAGAALFAGVVGVFAPQTVNFAGGLNQLTPAALLAGVAGLANLASIIAFVIQYFAAMKYLAWLAPRIPNYELQQYVTSKTWLIALLFFPGCCLAGIPAIVAIVLYYLLLGRFRIDFKRIRLESTGSSELWNDLIQIAAPQNLGQNPPSQPPNAP